MCVFRLPKFLTMHSVLFLLPQFALSDSTLKQRLAISPKDSPGFDQLFAEQNHVLPQTWNTLRQYWPSLPILPSR